ncbi:DUF5984 family protein [Embleya scabrispora]|uniref:DUF5984 family protein n=1 Tax=Embleya scabrispora TaxID=159449 RepID=UPI00036BC0DE|nr:DUF5984 family protein [Embleya scabrispora]MYS81117.1 hypothetical protein [Streptomyces sp. SID5474]
MLRFRFVLRPVTAVRVWGEDAPRLGWFILTDGWYSIELGGHELLRYADGTPGPQASAAGCAEAGAPPWVDYHVVRLWEDVVDLMPRVLEPVPPDLLDFVAGGQPDATRPAAPEVEAARSWHAGHALHMGHLSASPDIRFRRTLSGGADTMTVTWAHPADPDDDDPIVFTAPPTGRVTLSTEAFVAAVTAFDRELLAAMEERVAGFEAVGPPAGIDLDLRLLRHEQHDRATWLDRAMARGAETDWPAVRAGAAVLLGPAGESAHSPG